MPEYHPALLGDEWLPLSLQSAKTEKKWKAFMRKYQAEMAAPEKSRTLDLLSALSQESNFSVGCYCADEWRCHRSVLRALLLERGAKVE